jgi:hypothetical protein
MKQILFFLLLLPILVGAQIKKGSYYLQGSMTLQTNGSLFINDKSTVSEIGSSLPLTKLGLGKFVNNKHGFAVFILGSLGTSEFVGTDKNYTLGMGIAHCYIYPFKDHWGLLVNSEINARFGQTANNKNISNANDYLQKLKIVNAQFSPGIYYIFFNKIWVQANIDWVAMQHISKVNNPNLPFAERNQASKITKLNGLFPGPIQLADIQIKLSYLFQ